MVISISASTGGLLGLFMGFSVLSIIEILYFVSIRPYLINRRENEEVKKKKSGGDKKGLTDKRLNGNVKRELNRQKGSKVAWMKYDDKTGVDENYVPFPYTE